MCEQNNIVAKMVFCIMCIDICRPPFEIKMTILYCESFKQLVVMNVKSDPRNKDYQKGTGEIVQGYQ